MISVAKDQLADFTDSSGERAGILAEGIAGKAIIVGTGTPARGAQWFNLDIDLEVNIPGRQPYRVNNQFMVPASATLGQGVSLPVKVDQNDPAKIAIDWDSAQSAPGRGEVRPVAGSGFAPAPAPAPGAEAITSPTSSGSPSFATRAPSPTPSSSSRRRRSSVRSPAVSLPP